MRGVPMQRPRQFGEPSLPDRRGIRRADRAAQHGHGPVRQRPREIPERGRHPFVRLHLVHRRPTRRADAAHDARRAGPARPAIRGRSAWARSTRSRTSRSRPVHHTRARGIGAAGGLRQRRPDTADARLGRHQLRDGPRHARHPSGRTPATRQDIRQYLGDSRGRWEGDTLVVETTNFTDRTSIGPNGGGVRHSAAMRMVERFTRVDPEMIDYQILIDNPVTYSAPWTIAMTVTAQPDYEIYEFRLSRGQPCGPARAERRTRVQTGPRPKRRPTGFRRRRACSSRSTARIGGAEPPRRTSRPTRRTSGARGARTRSDRSTPRV